jgi:hypothetical protein
MIGAVLIYLALVFGYQVQAGDSVKASSVALESVTDSVQIQQFAMPTDWRGEVRQFRDSQTLGLLPLEPSLLFWNGTSAVSARQVKPDDAKKLRIELQDVRATFVANTEYGYARNYGAVFPSNGRTGLYAFHARARYGGLSINLAPEMVVSENKPFQLYPSRYPDWLWDLLYTNYLNQIDQPERYREYSYMQLLSGNSSIGYATHGMEVALTTRSMWWGPGRRNSLLMSTNAPGFAHLSINTVRPVKLPWGGIEFQWFLGRLVDSGREPVPPRLFENFQPMPYVPKPDDWRLLQGLLAIWHPKWSPGLYVGVGRTVMGYSESIKRVDHAFSVFRSLTTELLNTDEIQNPDLRERFDDKIAAYVRYVMPEDRLEFYAEVARNMRPGSLREFLARPEHTLAYTIGISKWYELGQRDRFFGIEAEFTQMEKQNTWQERYYQTWYTSLIVPHGYTNRGQIMGASIGPGSNSQYLGFNYRWRQNRVGTFVERVIYNNDLYYMLFTTSIYRLWSDVNVGLSGEYRYGKFDVFYDATVMRTFNYKYIETTTRPGYKYEGNDVWNLNVGLGVRYTF